MHMPVRRTHPAQQGMSLISLLVGLALALVCVVAAMHTYRVSVLNTRTAMASARTYNATAALSLHMNKLMPQAGWGLGATEPVPGGRVNVDFVLLQGAKATGPELEGDTVAVSATGQKGNGFVWSTAIDGSTKCYAMVFESPAGVTLRGPLACVNALTASDATWPAPVVLVAPEVFSALSFTASLSTCWPYSGATALSARESVQVQISGARHPLPNLCLANVHV